MQINPSARAIQLVSKWEKSREAAGHEPPTHFAGALKLATAQGCLKQCVKNAQLIPPQQFRSMQVCNRGGLVTLLSSAKMFEFQPISLPEGKNNNTENPAKHRSCSKRKLGHGAIWLQTLPAMCLPRFIRRWSCQLVLRASPVCGQLHGPLVAKQLQTGQRFDLEVQPHLPRLGKSNPAGGKKIDPKQ